MEFEIWLYYLLAVLVLTASPGPSVLLCMTKSVTEGFTSSIYTALGSLTAIVGIMTLSFTGLGVVIASSEIMFNIIKWLGSGYLIYLGYKALTSKEYSYEINKNTENPEKQSKFSLFSSGFIVGASNPKAIIFFTALFPQFISISEPLLSQYAIFCITFSVLELGWLLFYAYLGSKSSSWLLQKGRAQFFNKITGSVFVGAGVLLSTSRAQA
jgi:threonine/homoserine/homoserine lactone efflux protein